MDKKIRDIVADLVVDIRCAERDGLKDYVEKCRKELYYILENQKTLKFDRYGSVVIPKDILKK